MPVALALLTAALAAAPSLQLVPARARPGDAVLVVARGLDAAPAAALSGRQLLFFPVARGFAAVAGLPVETRAGPLEVALEAPGGAAGTSARLEVEPGRFPERALTVQREYVEPPSPELERRIAADRAAFARAFAQPPSPPLFSSGFGWPRRDRVTAGFGDRRTLNGKKPSQHYGLDLAGKVGAPVAAANAGRVVLVRDCWASGLSVIVWHGAGIYTAYFHLSRARVKEGAPVRRGQRLGDVGRSGRVSGPHLHWSVRVGDLFVDPASVLRLPFAKVLAAR